MLTFFFRNTQGNTTCKSDFGELTIPDIKDICRFLNKLLKFILACITASLRGLLDDGRLTFKMMIILTFLLSFI